MAFFKARARTVEMLGRQQIAGIPTAISELFKNAHDAYANHVEADLYRPDRLLVLRDDGIGMSETDFAERWLTLGTDSKLGSEFGLAPPRAVADREERPIMGEKGIGRLAISTLGPQVLILSRATKVEFDEDGEETIVLKDLVAALVNWELFAAPGIDLSEIQVPTRTLTEGALPSNADVKSLTKELRNSVKALSKRLDPATSLLILKQLESFDTLDPKRYFTKALTLANDGHGTAFFVAPIDETLRIELDDATPDRLSPIVRMLIGFSNTLSPPRKNQKRLSVAFRDHKAADDKVELINDDEFFTPTDFDSADHRIVGSFDDSGQFTGTVAVYDAKPRPYTLSPATVKWRKKDAATSCGPFSMRFAYLQGEQKSSRMDPDHYAEFERKLELTAGIYIYRDGIRVLPYGNSDVDFLDVEVRRSKNAGRAFFSYRRMFGAIEISRKQNPELQEKAGREGFRNNKAYRDFKAVLEHFLINLAADFFYEGGDNASDWQKGKEELAARDRTRKQREEQSKRARRDLQAKLGDFFQRTKDREPQKRAAELLKGVAIRLEQAAKLAAKQGTPEPIIDTESQLREQLNGLIRDYRIERPQGFALERKLQTDWNDYLAACDELEKGLFAQVAKTLEREVDVVMKSTTKVVEQRKRAERALQDQIRGARKKLMLQADSLLDESSGLHDRVRKRIARCIDELEQVMSDALDGITRAKESQFAASRDAFITSIDAVAVRNTDVLSEIRAQLASVDSSAEPGAKQSSLALVEALEEEVIALRERSDEALGIAQLGLAVEVISHEFGASIRGVRHSLKRLKSWGDANDKLRALYDELRLSFDHLDSYLNLFTPLSRRAGKRAIDIRGSDLADYLQRLFEERMLRHDVALSATKAFRLAAFHIIPSSLYPVFVNLLDNSLHWLSESKGKREIILDFRNGTAIVSDTGPGIPKRDHERIFERGFSKKVGGQGLGLYVSRAVLARSGYTICLAEVDKGASFEIRKVGT